MVPKFRFLVFHVYILPLVLSTVPLYDARWARASPLHRVSTNPSRVSDKTCVRFSVYSWWPRAEPGRRTQTTFETLRMTKSESVGGGGLRRIEQKYDKSRQEKDLNQQIRSFSIKEKNLSKDKCFVCHV